METRLAVFITLILTGNLMLLVFLAWFWMRWLARAARCTSSASRTIRALGKTLDHARTASDRFAGWSKEVRHAVSDAEDDLRWADNWVRYGLAKIDFNVERTSTKLKTTANQISSGISEPLYRTATILQGVKALLELLNCVQGDGRAGPRSAA